MRKLPAPAPIEAPKKEEPKERKPLVVETKGFDKIADSMTEATRAQGEATAALREAVAAISTPRPPCAFEVEIIREAGIMTKLIISPAIKSSTV
jgi:hypothetical protein